MINYAQLEAELFNKKIVLIRTLISDLNNILLAEK